MPTTLTGTGFAHARPRARRPRANTNGTCCCSHIWIIPLSASSSPPAHRITLVDGILMTPAAGMGIGITSYEALGHVPPPPTSNCLIFLVTSQSHTNSWHAGLYVVSLPRKNILIAYSFVTVYCMNFIIFLCVTHKLFSLSFMPLLAPNPGNATGYGTSVSFTVLVHSLATVV